MSELTKSELLHALGRAYEKIEQLEAKAKAPAQSFVTVSKPEWRGPMPQTARSTKRKTRARRKGAIRPAVGKKALMNENKVIAALPKGAANAVKLNALAAALKVDKQMLGATLKRLRDEGRAKMDGKLNGARHYR